MEQSKSVGSELEMRYDNCGHWVEFDKKKSRSRCRLPGCKSSTHAFCTKCSVHLCCNLNHNCFRAFHIPDKEKKQLNKAQPVKLVKPTRPVKQPIQMAPKKSGPKCADFAKRNTYRRQCNSKLGGSKAVTIAIQDTPHSILKTAKSTIKATRQTRCRKMQWKPDLFEDSVFSNASSNQDVGESASYVGNLASTQGGDMANSVLTQRQSRRKTKHQIKSNSDEVEFIEINE